GHVAELERRGARRRVRQREWRAVVGQRLRVGITGADVHHGGNVQLPLHASRGDGRDGRRAVARCRYGITAFRSCSTTNWISWFCSEFIIITNPASSSGASATKLRKPVSPPP